MSTTIETEAGERSRDARGIKRAAALAGILAAMLAAAALAPAAALALSEGRVYEQVSPEYKGGFAVIHILAVAENGESVAFFSPGAFKGAQVGLNGLEIFNYIARRGSEEWSTTPELPPASLTPDVESFDLSPTLGTIMILTAPGPNYDAGIEEGAQAIFMLHSAAEPDEAAAWEEDGPPLERVDHEPPKVAYFGASEDFCHMMVRESQDAPLLGEAVGLHQPFYELARGCEGEPAGLKLLAVDNSGRPLSPACQPGLGASAQDELAARQFNAISANGSEVFFTTCIDNDESDQQLFVRLGGVVTLEVSKPIDPALEACGEAEVPCPGASTRAEAFYQGASADGSHVYFTTAAPLVSGASAGSNLYLATIGCPGEVSCAASARRVVSLTDVSQEPHGAAAEVQGVVSVAPDGERVYFLARGDLLGQAQQTSLEAEGRPAPQLGAENMYVYDAHSGQVAFIADVCSGHEISGVHSDEHCPGTASDTNSLRGSEGSESGEHNAQTAGPSGEFLVFSSYGQLTSDDTNDARAVYRYDAETDTLTRVSIGEDGYDADGNEDASEASIATSEHIRSLVSENHDLGVRAISEDGSRIVFTTATRLSPYAINGLANAYEWHEGKVSLISTGSAEAPVEDVVISPSGRDVFFITTQGLVPQDTDGLADIYDARIGGGFPAPPAGTEPCSSDACQGPLTNPAPLLVPGSVSQAPGGNFEPPPAAKKAAPKQKKKKKGKSKKAHRPVTHARKRSGVRASRRGAAQ